MRTKTRKGDSAPAEEPGQRFGVERLTAGGATELSTDDGQVDERALDEWRSPTRHEGVPSGVGQPLLIGSEREVHVSVPRR